MRTYNALHVFAGIGGGALGFEQARAEFRGHQARFQTIGAIDVDPDACADLTLLTGRHATPMDLFTAEDFEAFHGHPPPDGWREATPTDLLAVTGGRRPDVVFGSPPCKGFSGLLGGARSKGEKYQALNRLVTRWLFLVLEAWRDDPPGLLLLENVPRIQQRGRPLLDRVIAMLRSYGYACSETVHDCGELGGLGQTRKRFLLVARHVGRVDALLYEPLAHPLRTIGDVVGGLPVPVGVEGGPMHEMPRGMKWQTWVRLALIRAGKDWRDLAARWAPDRWGVVPEQRRGKRFNNVFRLVDWAEASPTVTGGTSPSAGGLSVADPRVGRDWHSGVLGVKRLDETACTVTGSAGPTTGAFSVADPRLSTQMGPKSVTLRMKSWERPGPTVTGRSSVWDSGGFSVADPRLGGKAKRNGIFGVQPWDRSSVTVTGCIDVHAGTAAVADPRDLLADVDVPVIISDDDCWHRPLSTLELAALQGFPIEHQGQPLVLTGGSKTRWRMGIGNAVPPPTARAIAEQMLATLLVGAAGAFVLSGAGGVWVREAGVLRWHDTSGGRPLQMRA